MKSISIWWKNNYLWLLLPRSVMAGVGALALGYWQIPLLSARVVTEMYDQSNWGDDATRLRNLATAAAAMLTATAAFAAITFQLVKTWLNERNALTAEQANITDRIKGAVEYLGATRRVPKRSKRLVTRAADEAPPGLPNWSGDDG